MLILAVETSGPSGSLALGQFVGSKIAQSWSVSWQKKAIHSEMATIKLIELLTTSGKTLSEISHIAVDAGPGSFTGIRVGINLARTLAYGLSIPIATFTSLHLHAASIGNVGDTTFVAIRAIQHFYYAASYHLSDEGPKIIMPPTSVEAEKLKDLSSTCTKVGIEGETTVLPALEAGEILRTLDRWPEAIAFFSWKEVKPVYIRASEAEEKLLKGLLKREF